MVFYFAAADGHSRGTPDQERFTCARARFVAGCVGAEWTDSLWVLRWVFGWI